MNRENNLRPYKAIGTNQKIGSKVFAVKLPLVYEKRFLKLSPSERVIVMRESLMKAINEIE